MKEPQTADQKAAKPRKVYCDWTNNDDSDQWDTDCGKSFCINERETPEDAAMRFCCFCGNVLRQHV